MVYRLIFLIRHENFLTCRLRKLICDENLLISDKNLLISLIIFL